MASMEAAMGIPQSQVGFWRGRIAKQKKKTFTSLLTLTDSRMVEYHHTETVLILRERRNAKEQD